MSDDKIVKFGKVVEIAKRDDTSVEDCLKYIETERGKSGIEKIIFVMMNKEGAIAHGYSNMALSDLLAMVEWLKDAIKADAREEGDWP